MWVCSHLLSLPVDHLILVYLHIVFLLNVSLCPFSVYNDISYVELGLILLLNELILTNYMSSDLISE